MKSRMCKNCIKHKTIYCPNSDECLSREDKPFYEDKYTILTKIEALDETLKDYIKEIELLINENQELKKQLEEKENIACNWKDSCLENAGKIEKLENQQKEFIEHLENEKDRLARECSQIYEDSLGKTRYVNEDIFDEVNDVLQKYKEIIGVLDEKNN